MRGNNIGFLVEKVILAKLREKCEVVTDYRLDHTYKLDFLITHFREIDKGPPVGIQVTTFFNDIQKQREFLRNIQDNSVVQKAMYIEIDENAGIRDNGAALVYNSAVRAICDVKLKDIKVIGVQIYKDITFDLFDLGNHSIGDKDIIKGMIFKFFARGMHSYGFILDENKKTWYFRVNDIIDSRLESSFLPNIEVDANNNVINPIYVDFEPGVMGDTNDQDNPRAPRAINIRLSDLSTVRRAKQNWSPT